MAQRADSWVERLAKIVPGFAGYKAREDRRASDRALRQAIVSRLDDRRTVVDRTLAECSRQMKFDALEDLEAVRRRLQLVADMVRYAPAGYSGFFDRFEVKEADLDLIYGHDLRVRELVEQVAAQIGALDASSPTLREQAAAALKGVSDVETLFRARDSVVTGVE